MRRFLFWVLLVLALVVSVGAGFFWGYARGSASIQTAEREAMEREFARSMSGVVLEGSFTAGEVTEGRLRTERYTIESVEKIAGDYWLFHARIQYGENDVSLPVPVKLTWASDTPVVSLTDVALPGLGTFTARVVFYRNRYAGLWLSSEAGGHQFGNIVRTGD